ncbi:hypothetical protein [Cellulomonas soli]|uniref:Lipoprotein LpqB beta-propeller domain-containing protein n=1 Tax=Cellulomonas soli TaxID=931535 RepID=A0A512PEM9_9CELL|nr:hypothetical protein [Cellulomonas soli]NYI58868.1 hypothetical protein [Cellulomonas soli]GEP69636.1 hypothetical protein CSO01_23510 [Cellulomonas soli]
MRASRRVAALVVATALTASGCAVERPGPPSSAVSPTDAAGLPSGVDATAQPGALTWVDGTVVVARDVSLSSARLAAEGVDLVRLSTSPAPGDGSSLGALALLADGSLVVSRAPADQYDGGAWLSEPSVIGTLVDGEFRAWPSSQDVLEDEHPRQVYDASADGDVVAWAETPSTQVGVDPWRIFARTGDGATTLVARAEDAGAGGEAGSLLVAGERVYWASSRGVVSRDVAGEEPIRLEVPGAAQPAIGDGGLYVARTGPDGTFGVARADGEGGSSPVLAYTGPAGASVGSLVADGDRLAFVVTSPTDTGGSVQVADLAASTVTSVALPSSGRSTSLALCGDRLIWTSADGSGTTPDEPVYVLDLVSGDLVGVVVPGSFGGVLCAGDLVAWRTLVPPDRAATTTVVRWGAG